MTRSRADAARRASEPLRETVGKVARGPALAAAMQKQSIVFDYRDAPDFARFADEDRLRMTRVVPTASEVSVVEAVQA